MIKSIKFPKQGDGYLYAKPENPGKAPNKESYEYSDWDFSNNGEEGKKAYKEEKFARDYARWEEEKKYYDENKGKFINPAAKTLIGKEFNFEPGKLNIIFGPNGCGKTTILKAIAGTAGIAGDGMTRPGDPLDVFGWDNDRENIESVAKHIEELKQNTADVVWDGNVVYYDNFAHTFSQGNSFIGGLEGTALGSFSDEITFRMAGSKTNAGRRAMWMLGNVLEYQKMGLTLKKIFEPFLKNKRQNDTWYKSYKTQDEYFQQFENYDKEVPMTILFDEPEVNFDIVTVWNLYHNAFPTICEKMGTQIITVSHSPIVMCEDIINNEHINLISLDESYTKSVKQLLQTMRF